MLIRIDGEWHNYMDPVPFYTREFAESFIGRVLASRVWQLGPGRLDDIGRECRSWCVEDADELWGISYDRMAEVVAPEVFKLIDADAAAMREWSKMYLLPEVSLSKVESILGKGIRPTAPVREESLF